MPPKHSLTFIPSWPTNIFMKKTFVLFHKLVLLVFALGLFSCENPIGIGLDLTETNGQSVYTDTLSLDVSTVLADSTYNGNGAFVMAGNLRDPYTGTINSVAYLQPTIAYYSSSTVIDTFKVSSSAIADSLVLRLVNTGLMFGDTLSKSSFGIYRLKSSMESGKHYNGSDRLEIENEPLAKFKLSSATFKTDKYDSLVAYSIKLPIAMARELLALGVTGYNDNTKFNADFKGFAIKPESDAKAVYTFNTGPLGNSTSYLGLHFHFEGDTASTVEYFDFNGARHSGVIANRAGTSLLVLNNTNNEVSNVETGGFSYAQAGTGLSTKIGFKNLSKISKNLKIEKATLELNIDNGSATKDFPRIFNYVLAEAGDRNQQTRNSSNLPNYLINNTLSTVGFLYGLVDTTNTLNIDITHFLQNKINKGLDIGSILILPAMVSSTEGYGILTNDHLRRSVFRKPKLKLYYSK